MAYIAELSDAHNVIRRYVLGAATLAGAKRVAKLAFPDTRPERTITVCEIVSQGFGNHYRPLAARLCSDRRQTDWVDFS